VVGVAGLLHATIVLQNIHLGKGGREGGGREGGRDKGEREGGIKGRGREG